MPAKSTPRKIDFENIADLTDREIQVMLRQVDTKDLALALLSASARLKDRIFANVSERVSGMIKEEMSLGASKAKAEIVGVQIMSLTSTPTSPRAGVPPGWIF